MTVLGPVDYDQLGVTDAHNHVWIDPVVGADPHNPVLNQRIGILLDLLEYHQAGGSAILDCQPGMCGRNGPALVDLARSSGVNLIACTGYHLKKYYPQDHWLWQSDSQTIADFMLSELDSHLTEVPLNGSPVRAGFIKIALEAEWEDIHLAMLEGAAYAGAKTGAVIEIHTEKGCLAEKIVTFFEAAGISPNQLVLCHMDKRADFGLHSEFAKAGVLLEYDTFYRPKYLPEQNLWPLIDQMIANGFSHRIALATDMAEAASYRHLGGGPGLTSLPGQIRRRLQKQGYPEKEIQQVLGGNIVSRLAGINLH
jgi:phosphotriesterase-related protein